MNILLGLTGSVASVLYLKLIDELSVLGNVDVILTEKAHEFIDIVKLDESKARDVYTDKDEWDCGGKWKKNDRILHIKLRNEADVLVIAPLSANTMAKLSHGICDNLLTTVARAWDPSKPIVVAPAMNTAMWDHPLTKIQIQSLKNLNYLVVPPQKKLLACGDTGTGALAEINSIVETVTMSLVWKFPLTQCTGIPITPHPGAFKAVRRDNHIHTGVDLYTNEGQEVCAVEAGRVVSIEPFTGPKDNSPWWKDTEAVLVEGYTGVVCYGEVQPVKTLAVGDLVKKGQYIANVKRVILEGKERYEITGWKPSMLHMELYPHGTTKASDGYINVRDFLQDPTPHLIKSIQGYKPFGMNSVDGTGTLTWEPSK